MPLILNGAEEITWVTAGKLNDAGNVPTKIHRLFLMITVYTIWLECK